MLLPRLFLGALLQLALVSEARGLDFVVAGGQIFTPGLAVVDAPQPGTPLGGGWCLFYLDGLSRRPANTLAENLHVAIDVSANGRLPLPPNLAPDSPSQIYNITIFLYSYDTGKNLTVSNGTAPFSNGNLETIMLQEPDSTVKHVNWNWPDCLVGDGQPKDFESSRGVYNVSCTAILKEGQRC